MVIKTYDPVKGKHIFVGRYDPETKTFFKKVSTKHYMVKEKGYGFQEEAVDILDERGCEKVVLQLPSKKLLSFDFKEFAKHEPRSYGHGLQRFIPVADMKEIT